MNRLAWSGVVVAMVAAGSVRAADLPVKAPFAPAPVSSWTGLYLGIHAGGSWDTQDWFYPGTNLNQLNRAPVAGPFNVPVSSHSAAGPLAGFQVGYNHQIANWVLGAEAEFSWTRLNGSTPSAFYPNINHSQASFLATMGGRVGYAFDHLLLFGEAGGAWANSKYSTTAASNFVVGDPTAVQYTVVASSAEATATTNRFGLMLGAGAEYALTPNWSVKVEYEYLDFGRERITLSPQQAFLAPFHEDIREQLHLVKVGINYKLNPTTSMIIGNAQLGSGYHGGRFYAGGEYLLWAVKGAPLSVPLVTYGPGTFFKQGFLTSSSTSILYGASMPPGTGGSDVQNFPLSSGGRVTLGYWLDDAHSLAVEGRAFALQKRSAGFSASGDGTGVNGLRVPVYSNVPYAPGGQCDPSNPAICLIGRTEDGVPISIPGALSGSVKISNDLQLWGADGSAVLGGFRAGNWEISPLVGVRYLQLSENFQLTADLNGLPTSPMYAGQSGTAVDQFDTRNDFFGGVLGLRGRTFWGPLSLEMSGRIALGVNHEVLTVAGFYRDNMAPFANSSGPYGIFAMPANSGTFTRNEFAVVPEGQVKIGYDVTSSMRVTLGYDFLYDSNVIRPGDQINRNVPKGQTFQQDGTPASTASPASLFKPTDLYTHGLSAGLLVRF